MNKTNILITGFIVSVLFTLPAYACEESLKLDLINKCMDEHSMNYCIQLAKALNVK